MARIFSICTRLLVYGLTISTCASLGISTFCSTPADSPPIWSGRWDVLTAQSWSDRFNDHDRHYLVDREGARPSPLVLPKEYRWGLLSVSPWTDQAGAREAVSACYRAPSDGAGPFWGLARIGLTEGRIIDEIELDVLPTGRPAWVPERPGKVLFAAADGRLYCHDFLAQQAEREASVGIDSSIPGGLPTKPVLWASRALAASPPYITDPSWPDHPRLRHLLVGSVIPRSDLDHRAASDLTELCWFEIDPEGSAITAAGILLDPNNGRRSRPTVVARFPVLCASAGGITRLVYLARTSGQRAVRLESLAIELDPESKRPRIAPGGHPVVLDADAAMAPLVVSADGDSVFYLAGKSAQPTRCVLGTGNASPVRTALSAIVPRR
jgi:hypothetical protein